MEQDAKSDLERILVNDLSESLKVGVKFFSELDNKKADWMFYMVVTEDFYNRIKDNKSYKSLSNEELNGNIFPNIRKIARNAEVLALKDTLTYDRVSKMAKKDINVNDGILNVLPNFPPSFDHYLSFRDYIVGMMALNADNQRFEVKSDEPVIDLFDVLYYVSLYLKSQGIDKSVDLTVKRSDGSSKRYRNGMVYLQKPNNASEPTPSYRRFE